MIWAMTTICGNEGIELFPYWIGHYSQWADRMLVCVTDDTSVELPHYQETGIFGKVIVAHIPTAFAIGAEQSHSQRRMALRHGMKNTDWVLPADLDEFHEFPDDLHRLISLCLKEDVPAIYGHLVDMVEENGRLVSIRTDLDHYDHAALKQQFPVAARLTELIVKGGTKKVMAHQASITTGAGHHDVWVGNRPLYETGQEKNVAGRREDYIVRHYKWKEGLIERLESQMNSGYASPRWCGEAKAFLSHVRRNGGKIGLNDPPELRDISARNLDIPTA